MDRAPPHGAVDRPIYRASNENFHRSSAISEMESRLQRLERELAKERKKNTFLQGLHTAWEKDIEIIKDDFDRNERFHEEKINELKLKIKEDESTKSKLNEDIQKIGAMLENQRRDFESKLADKDSALANVDKTKTMWEAETVELKAQLKEKCARESESRGMIEQLQRVNHNLELERNDLQNRLNGSEEAIGKMEKSEQLLKSKMDYKEIHLNELKALIEKLQTEIKKKDNRGVERSKEIQDLQKSNRDMQVAQKELNDRLKASEGSNAIYKLNMERTTKELQSKIDRGEQRVKKCEASMKQLRQRNNELEIERNGLRDRLLVSEKAAGKMKSIENKLQSKIHSEELLQQNMKELETYTEKLQSEIERKNVREAELNKVIQDLQKSNRDNEVARNQMRNMLKSSEGLNATYISDMEKMKEEMQSRIDAKEQKVKECEASMEKLFAKLEEKRTAELALKDAIKDLKQSNSDIELERVNLKATLQRFKTDYEAKLSITKEKLQSAIDSKEQMRGKVEELEAAAKGLQAKLEEKHAEVDELSLQINLQKQIDHDLAIERDRLLNTNKSLEDSFVNSQRERETIEQKLQSKSDEHEANVTVLRTQIEAMKTERNNLNKKIIQLETEVSLLKNLSEREQLVRKLASTEKLKADSKVLSARKDDRSSVASDVCISGDTASLIDRSSSQASDANESEHHITQNNSGYKQDQRTEDSTSLSGSFRKIGYKFWKKFGNEWFEGEVKFIYPVIHSYYEDGDDDIVKEEEFKKLYEQGEISNVDPKSRAQCSQSTKSRGNGKRRRQKRQRMK